MRREARLNTHTEEPIWILHFFMENDYPCAIYEDSFGRVQYISIKDFYFVETPAKKQAKVLMKYYSDGSGFQVLRVYLETDFERAVKDLQLLEEGTPFETFKILETKIY